LAPQGLWGIFGARRGLQLLPLARRLIRAKTNPPHGESLSGALQKRT
jgi:hypothetical protein